MSETLKYKILTFIRYLGDSFFYPFFALYLEDRGLIESEIGFILSISPLVGILINPFYSSICKNIKITKNVLTIITILEAIIIMIISFSNGVVLISMLTILMAVFGSCHYGLFDSLLVSYAEKANINYSSIRIYGSSAYIIGTTLGGFIIDLTSYQICFGICGILFILSGLFYSIIKVHKDSKDKTEMVEFKKVFINKSLWLFILLYVLIMGPLVCGDYFFSVYIKSRGLNSTHYGLIYAFYVLVEVVLLFIFNKKADKLNNNLLLVIAGFVVMTRLLINGLYLPIIVIVIISSFRGIAYAILLHVSFKKVIDIVGNNNSTFGVLLMTLCQSIFVFIFNNIDGMLVEYFDNYSFFYIMMAVITLIGVIISIINYLNNKMSKLKG